jgi:ligand-binding sensor domain-containing protein
MDQIIGEPFQRFLAEQNRELFGKQLANNQPVTPSVDVALVAADGSSRPVHLSMASLYFGSRQVRTRTRGPRPGADTIQFRARTVRVRGIP